MAGDAFLGKDLRALRRRAAAGRQTGAVGQDGDVPGLDVGFRDRLAELRTLRRARTGAERKRKERRRESLTRRHA